MLKLKRENYLCAFFFQGNYLLVYKRFVSWPFWILFQKYVLYFSCINNNLFLKKQYNNNNTFSHTKWHHQLYKPVSCLPPCLKFSQSPPVVVVVLLLLIDSKLDSVSHGGLQRIRWTESVPVFMPRSSSTSKTESQLQTTGLVELQYFMSIFLELCSCK